MNMEFIEQLREGLKLFALMAVFILEAVSIFCVLVGFLKAILCFPGWQSDRRGSSPFLKVRLTFARWLALALEFQLAADILSTTVEPSTEELIRLTIIAVVRTFLNYFLEKEMAEELELKATNSPASTQTT